MACATVIPINVAIEMNKEHALKKLKAAEKELPKESAEPELQIQKPKVATWFSSMLSRRTTQPQSSPAASEGDVGSFM